MHEQHPFYEKLLFDSDTATEPSWWTDSDLESSWSSIDSPSSELSLSSSLITFEDDFFINDSPSDSDYEDSVLSSKSPLAPRPAKLRAIKNLQQLTSAKMDRMSAKKRGNSDQMRSIKRRMKNLQAQAEGFVNNIISLQEQLDEVIGQETSKKRRILEDPSVASTEDR